LFNEKNIPKLIIFTPIITIIILTITILYSIITIQQDYLEKEVIKLENDYIYRQKIILEKEIDYLFNYIEYHKQIMLDNIKKNLETQMNAFNRIIITKDLSSKEYLKYIDENSNRNSDFMIYNITNNILLKNDKVFFNKSQLINIKQSIIDNIKFFKIEEESDLYFYKYIEEKNIIVIIKRDIYYDIDNLKNTIAKWSEYLRFGDNNYFWIYKHTNRLLAHPYRKEFIGTDDTLLKDGKGNFFVQDFVKDAIKNPKGKYLEYFWNKPNKKEKIKKLAFVKFYKEWNWIIGAGVYFDDVQNVIIQKEEALRKTIFKYIQITTIIAIFLIIIISYISIIISKKINFTIKSYQTKVKLKERKLQNLNESLNEKIKFAIKESQEKDRAMLHQSRLARMGELLNMISHQWRQPLSQLAGVIMELETNIIFKKYKRKQILTATKDATNIIQYMSLTIEDFKNFFKPEKNKEDFYILKACEEAISLIKDTLINEKIKLELNIKKDILIKGYKREYSQVILNLLGNAKDALISNNIKNPLIKINIDVIDNSSIVKVEDNAGGIKITNINSIFEPYFSTKQSQGTGLGLYMSKMIIEKNMNGKLSVMNNKNGAVFTIKI
jgi:two-component system, NtrC family, C4-dicarboxylate transport sensor histidine kinase DctB